MTGKDSRPMAYKTLALQSIWNLISVWVGGNPSQMRPWAKRHLDFPPIHVAHTRDTANAGRHAGDACLLPSCWFPPWKSVWRLLNTYSKTYIWPSHTASEHTLPHTPKSADYGSICLPMFVAKFLNQPRYPITNRWIKKPQYISTTDEVLLHLKENR